jgi:hypothetical protein
MTWFNEYNATPGLLLASSAICCCFVYRFAGFSVPSRVSHQQFSPMASPFSPTGPIDQVPRLRRYYGDATPSCIACRSLMISLPASVLPSRVSCLAFALPSGRRRSFRARGISMPASPIPAFPHGQHRTSQVPWPSIPCLCHAPRPRSDPDILTHSVCLNAAPAPNTTKATAFTSFRGQNTHGFNICCLRFTNRVASAHARLTSGWRAHLYREGVEPSGSLRKVSGYSTFLPPLQGLP